MGRYYTKNAYVPVGRIHYIGAQYIGAGRAEREIDAQRAKKRKIPRKTKQRSMRERKGWKCDECSIMLIRNKKMLRIRFAMLLCMGCYAELDAKNSRQIKKTPTYKRFIGKYGKAWHRRFKGLKK